MSPGEPLNNIVNIEIRVVFGVCFLYNETGMKIINGGKA